MAAPLNSNKFIQIDEEGYFHFDGQRVVDAAFARDLLNCLVKSEFGSFYCDYKGDKITAEAFDEPLIVYQIHPQDGFVWRAQTPYNFQFDFDLKSLRVDDWDRFHGHSEEGIPFVFNRSAQADFFNLVTEFDDDSVTVQGQKIPIPTMFNKDIDTQPAEYWSNIYKNENTPGWEMNEPNPALASTIEQMKIPKCRILVPGCGSANDAAYLASKGHMVTAIDYSEEAVKRAREKYGNIEGLTIIQADFFKFSREHAGSYDLIVEHTFFSAIPPNMRKDYVSEVTRLLVNGGQLIGVFFVMDRQDHPPWGTTEWELRQRLKNKFKFLYWTRWKLSEGFRKGIELIIAANKLD